MDDNQFDNGFLSDLTAVRDNIILRVRIVRTWMQPMRNNPKVINMELIIMDEQCPVQDETGTASLVLFKKEVKSLLNGVSAYQLLATRERYAFKINMDDWQSKKELPLWSDDHEIINADIPLITPSKDQTSDAVVKDTNVPQLDLESVMDENGTPSELLKSITSTPNNSGSTTKRQLIKEMGENN
ncbi:hypothetical protein Tco_0213102 [Tanacetum coccineum]